MTRKKKKGFKLLVGLVLLVILLILYVVVHNMEDKNSETETDDTKEITILDMDTSTITSFSFISKKETLTFVLEDGIWYFDEDHDFPIVQDNIKTMLSNLAAVTATYEIPDVEDLAEYGLDNPSQLITLTTEDGEEVKLYIGDLNISTSTYYAYLNEYTSSVYTIATTIPTAFEKGLYDLVDASDFPKVDTSTIYYASVEQEGSKIEFNDESSRDATPIWSIKKDDANAKSADAARINTLFTNIDSFAYDSCVEYNVQDLSKYGLDNPSAAITLDYTTEYQAVSEETDTNETAASDTENSAETTTEEDEIVLYIGDQVVKKASEIEENGNDTSVDETEAETQETESFYYVQVKGSNEVHIMSDKYLKPFLTISVESYYNTYVSYYYINDVPKLVVTRGGQKYELTMETVTDTTTETNESGEEEYNGTSTPHYYVNGGEVTSAAYTSFFSAAANMMVEYYAAEEVELSGDPALSLEFEIEDKTVIVEYYAYDSNFYAVGTAQGIGFVNKRDVTSMITALEALIADEGGTTN